MPVKHTDRLAPELAVLDELAGLSRSAGRADLSARLDMARSRTVDPRIRLVVVGAPKHGMSTLVNGLVGSAVSATDSPVSVPVIAAYGPQPTATLIRHVNGRTERQPVDPLNPGPALAAEGVVRAEFTEPSALLAEGVVLMDAPGGADAPGTWPLIAAADAVLYVSEAAVEYSPSQLALLKRIRQACPTVICVLNKIDRFPHWARVQQRNRELLDAADLGFAVAPVSAKMHWQAGRGRDGAVESGVPQLIEHLRDYVLARADAVAADVTRSDARAVCDQLTQALRAEADILRDPQRADEAADRLRAVRAEVEELRLRAANWQLALSDGCAELMAEAEHDLRQRLRVLLREAEAELADRNPFRGWAEFGTDLDARIRAAVEESFLIAHYQAVELAERLAGKFVGPGDAVALPSLRLGEADEVLASVTALEPLTAGRGTVPHLSLTVMRGSYAGLLMVGLLTSMLKMPLVNWYSGAAAVVLGGNALWEDRKHRRDRRQIEAKLAVTRLMDDVVFQVGKESRTRLRAAQRLLRDHFTDVAAGAMRTLDESQTAAEAAAVSYHPETRSHRLSEIDASLGRLAALRAGLGG
ncbi:P-loop NTPase family protein [Nocardia stercoris]|uniref:hypothetical protein n=1 Tax=Nocardia stercoris TaxID=2483361 RepID=UPI001F31C893|nr:hypothetical protein [Nocardia stercoris]